MIDGGGAGLAFLHFLYGVTSAVVAGLWIVGFSAAGTKRLSALQVDVDTKSRSQYRMMEQTRVAEVEAAARMLRANKSPTAAGKSATRTFGGTGFGTSSLAGTASFGDEDSSLALTESTSSPKAINRKTSLLMVSEEKDAAKAKKVAALRRKLHGMDSQLVGRMIDTVVFSLDEAPPFTLATDVVLQFVGYRIAVSFDPKCCRHYLQHPCTCRRDALAQRQLIAAALRYACIRAGNGGRGRGNTVARVVDASVSAGLCVLSCVARLGRRSVTVHDAGPVLVCTLLLLSKWRGVTAGTYGARKACLLTRHGSWLAYLCVARVCGTAGGAHGVSCGEVCVLHAEDREEPAAVFAGSTWRGVCTLTPAASVFRALCPPPHARTLVLSCSDLPVCSRECHLLPVPLHGAVVAQPVRRQFPLADLHPGTAPLWARFPSPPSADLLLCSEVTLTYRAVMRI